MADHKCIEIIDTDEGYVLRIQNGILNATKLIHSNMKSMETFIRVNTNNDKIMIQKCYDLLADHYMAIGFEYEGLSQILKKFHNDEKTPDQSS